MNTEPKPLASLSSSLLARKGQASPAMRRQAMMTGFGLENDENGESHLEDLGWNDMGHDRNSGGRAGLSPMATHQMQPDADQPSEPTEVHARADQVSPLHPHVQPETKQMDVPAVVHQLEKLNEVFEPAPIQVRAKTARAPTPRAAAGSKSKAAFTLRLDPERHLKLRLVCAVKHKSAQQVVTEALDMLLARSPEANMAQPSAVRLQD